MNGSQERALLSAALAAAQAAFEPIEKKKEAKEAITKDGKRFGGYKFADLAQVLAATRPALNKNAISVTWDFEGGICRCYLMHESGQWLSSTYPGRIEGSDHQTVGKAMTYAKRYSYLAAIGAHPEDEDDDAPAVQTTVATEKAAEMLKAKARPLYEQLQADLRSCQSAAAVRLFGRERQAELDSLPHDWKETIRQEYVDALEYHKRAEAEVEAAKAFEAEALMARRDG